LKLLFGALVINLFFRPRVVEAILQLSMIINSNFFYTQMNMQINAKRVNMLLVFGMSKNIAMPKTRSFLSY